METLSAAFASNGGNTAGVAVRRQAQLKVIAAVLGLLVLVWLYTTYYKKRSGASASASASPIKYNAWARRFYARGLQNPYIA